MWCSGCIQWCATLALYTFTRINTRWRTNLNAHCLDCSLPVTARSTIRSAMTFAATAYLRLHNNSLKHFPNVHRLDCSLPVSVRSTTRSLPLPLRTSACITNRWNTDRTLNGWTVRHRSLRVQRYVRCRCHCSPLLAKLLPEILPERLRTRHYGWFQTLLATRWIVLFSL